MTPAREAIISKPVALDAARAETAPRASAAARAPEASADILML